MEDKLKIEYIIRRSDLFKNYVRGIMPIPKEAVIDFNKLVEEIQNRDEITKKVFGD